MCMKLRFRSHENISKDDRRLLDVINLPEVEPFFILPEIKGLKTDTEDIHLLCVRRKIDGREEMTKKRFKKNEMGLFQTTSSKFEGQKIRKIKHIDVPEQGSEATASSVIDAREINKQCPTQDWHRIWFHTHNHSISAQSIDDRFATQNIHANGIGETMCAVGINGVTCHFPSSNPPAVATSKWGNSFWELLKKYNKSMNLLQPIQQMNKNWDIRNEIEAKTDQILCYMSLNGGKIQHNCYGRNWENGTRTFPIGKFDSIYIDGPTDLSNNSTISIPRDNKYECVSIKIKAGRKLICH